MVDAGQRDDLAVAEPARRGKPLTIVSDNGTELTSRAILAWCEDTGIEWHYIAPGKPTRDTASWSRSMVACATSA